MGLEVINLLTTGKSMWLSTMRRGERAVGESQGAAWGGRRDCKSFKIMGIGPLRGDATSPYSDQGLGGKKALSLP